VHSFDEWWRAIRDAAAEMELDRVRLRHPDGERNWVRDPGRSTEGMTFVATLRFRDDGVLRLLRVEASAGGGAVSPADRLALFSRLLTEEQAERR
jgi:hypothetical protein